MKADIYDSMTYALKQMADNAGRNNKMRKWKVIKTDSPKHWTIGQIYTTNNNGRGLVTNDGYQLLEFSPWDLHKTIFEEVFEDELTNEEVVELFIETYGNDIQKSIFGKIMTMPFYLDYFTSKEIVERLKAYKKSKQKTPEQIKIEEIKATISELSKQVEKLEKGEQ